MQFVCSLSLDVLLSFGLKCRAGTCCRARKAPHPAQRRTMVLSSASSFFQWVSARATETRSAYPRFPLSKMVLDRCQKVRIKFPKAAPLLPVAGYSFANVFDRQNKQHKSRDTQPGKAGICRCAGLQALRSKSCAHLDLFLDCS